MKRRIVALLLVVLSANTMFGCGKNDEIDTSDITIDGIDTSSDDLFSTTEYSTDLTGGASVADEAQTFGNSDMSINTTTGGSLDLQGAMATDPTTSAAETTTPATSTTSTTPATSSTSTTPATSSTTSSSTSSSSTSSSSSSSTNYTYTDTSAVMYATSNVKVRDLPSTSGKQVGSFLKDAEVKVTGKCNETGWYRVAVTGGTGYISNNYLTSTKPATATTSTTNTSTTTTAANTTTGTTTGTYTITDMTATMTTNDNVKVRSLPYTNGTEITTLAKGTVVSVTGQCKETSWYRVSINGNVGYISNQYVTGSTSTASTAANTTTSGTYTITETVASMKASTGVNVRSLPHATGSKIGSLSAGQVVQVTGKCNETGWYRINLNGQVGYVSGSYLLDTSPNSQTNTTLGATTTSNVSHNNTTTITATTTTTGATTVTPYSCTLYATNAISVSNSPATGATSLGTIAYGNAVYCTGLVQQNGQNTGWIQINFNGSTGYVPNANLTSLALPQSTTTTSTTPNVTSSTSTSTTAATSNTYTITDMSGTMSATTQVKVRSLPAQTGTQIGSILANQPVTVTGKCNETGWYRISYNGAVGYVSNQYLK